MNSIDISGGPVLSFVIGLAAAVVVAIALRRRSRRRIAILTATAAGGALIGAGVVALVTIFSRAGETVPFGASIALCATGAAVAVALADLVISDPVLRGTRVRPLVQTTASMVAIILFLTAGGLAANASYGLNRSVGALLTNPLEQRRAVQSSPVMEPPVARSSTLDDAALWSRWTPPAGMPLTGTTSRVDIPNTASGFVSRSAGLYLPPAALVANPPPLPFVIMLMGQPGKPDPAPTALILDRFAATHHGLAPIVLVPDQLGDPAVDPLCVDSARFGKVETFLTLDVVNWARSHLHILQDPEHWTIAGYSNGGECALSLSAKFPTVWKNVLDISGELFPGSENPAKALLDGFAGDQSLYDAEKPLNILDTYMASHGRYKGMTGVFTVGSDNTSYVPQAQAASAAARAAGWTVTYFEVPHGGHRMPALLGGLEQGYSVLYPVLGLAEATVTGDPNPLPIPTAMPTPPAAAPPAHSPIPGT